MSFRIIAHRGLTDGPDPFKENSPAQVERALAAGFDAEVDVWFVWDEWWLGHDHPKYLVDAGWLDVWVRHLWLHCKNAAALEHAAPSWNTFWHETDAYARTAHGQLWTYPGQPVPRDGVSLQLDCRAGLDLPYQALERWAGLCTDLPYIARGLLER